MEPIVEHRFQQVSEDHIEPKWPLLPLNPRSDNIEHLPSGEETKSVSLANFEPHPVLFELKSRIIEDPKQGINFQDNDLLSRDQNAGTTIIISSISQHNDAKPMEKAPLIVNNTKQQNHLIKTAQLKASGNSSSAKSNMTQRAAHNSNVVHQKQGNERATQNVHDSHQGADMKQKKSNISQEKPHTDDKLRMRNKTNNENVHQADPNMVSYKVPKEMPLIDDNSSRKYMDENQAKAELINLLNRLHHKEQIINTQQNLKEISTQSSQKEETSACSKQTSNRSTEQETIVIVRPKTTENVRTNAETQRLPQIKAQSPPSQSKQSANTQKQSSHNSVRPKSSTQPKQKPLQSNSNRSQFGTKPNKTASRFEPKPPSRYDPWTEPKCIVPKTDTKVELPCSEHLPEQIIETIVKSVVASPKPKTETETKVEDSKTPAPPTPNIKNDEYKSMSPKNKTGITSPIIEKQIRDADRPIFNSNLAVQSRKNKADKFTSVMKKKNDTNQK